MAKSKDGMQNQNRRGVTTFTARDGTVIDLRNHPLIYSEGDKAMSEATAKTIRAFEKKRTNNKIEYAIGVDENGNIRGREYKGGNTGVRVSEAALNSHTFTHTHPRTDNLSGTFSDADLSDFGMYPNSVTYRAVGAEGIYYITRGKNYNGQFRDDYAKAVAANHAAKVERNKQADLKYVKQQISYAERAAEKKRNFTQELIDNHNWLLKNQKKYGYKYGLERW